MQFCTRCGAALPDDGEYCSGCGQRIDGMSGNIKGRVTSHDHGRLDQYESMQHVAGNRALWWGAGIVGVLIVAGLITFYAVQIMKPTPESQVNTRVETKGSPSTQAATAVSPNYTLNASTMADFRIYVQTKERINTDIIDLASQINGRINQTGTLRYSHDLRNRARMIIDDIARHSSALSSKSYPPELQGAKTMLLQLFDLEMTRARSLYNGLTEGLNGDDYSSSFSVGTRAAYEFDDLNVRFVQEYSWLR